MKRLFWTLDKFGNEVIRDLEKENEDFSIEEYNHGKFDGNNFIWYEMFGMHLMDANGCDYERKGCYIKEGDVVVDIGANIGIFAHRAELRGASRVICFEPFIPSYNCLVKNLGPKSEAFRLGVGGENKFQDFAVHTDYTHIGGVFSMDKKDNFYDKEIIQKYTTFTININTIFDEVLTDRIDFLKIDVEGGEEEIINNITDENLQKLRCFSAEFHKTNDDFDNFQQQFLDRMDRLGFNYFTLYHGTDVSAYLRTISCWKK